MFDAVGNADLGAMARLLHEDIVVVEPESLPYGGVYRGRDAFLRELLPAMLGGFELAVEDVRLIDGGERVAGQLTVVLTSRERGDVLRMPYVEVYEFGGGLICSIEVYPQDTATLAAFLDTGRA